jgi:hypothetical protein
MVLLPKIGPSHVAAKGVALTWRSKGRQDRKASEARCFLNGQIKKEVVAGEEPQDWTGVEPALYVDVGASTPRRKCQGSSKEQPN